MARQDTKTSYRSHPHTHHPIHPIAHFSHSNIKFWSVALHLEGCVRERSSRFRPGLEPTAGALRPGTWSAWKHARIGPSCVFF